MVVRISHVQLLRNKKSRRPMQRAPRHRQIIIELRTCWEHSFWIGKAALQRYHQIVHRSLRIQHTHRKPPSTRLVVLSVQQMPVLVSRSLAQTLPTGWRDPTRRGQVHSLSSHRWAVVSPEAETTFPYTFLEDLPKVSSHCTRSARRTLSPVESWRILSGGCQFHRKRHFPVDATYTAWNMRKVGYTDTQNQWKFDRCPLRRPARKVWCLRETASRRTHCIRSGAILDRSERVGIHYLCGRKLPP
jgi:hypothetical protein